MKTSITKDLAQFDYEGIDPEVKSKLICLSGEISRSGKSHIEHALKMGESISLAHELLAGAGCEGKFKPWIEAECGITRQTAYNYMHAWQRFGEVSNVLHFTNDGMYLLSAPTVPEGAAKEAVKLASKGVRITVDKAKAILEKFRPSEKSAPRPRVLVQTEPKPAAPPAAEPAKRSSAPQPEPSPPTVDERIAEWNRKVESFARSITALSAAAPVGGWWDDTQANIVAQQLKSAAGAARQAKCEHVCPKCEGEGKHPKALCKWCKGTGFMPRRSFEVIGK